MRGFTLSLPLSLFRPFTYIQIQKKKKFPYLNYLGHIILLRYWASYGLYFVDRVIMPCVLHASNYGVFVNLATAAPYYTYSLGACPASSPRISLSILLYPRREKRKQRKGKGRGGNQKRVRFCLVLVTFLIISNNAKVSICS